MLVLNRYGNIDNIDIVFIVKYIGIIITGSITIVMVLN